MYTHTFPGGWNWLSITLGQYTLSAYDSNQYASNEQTNLISYPLLQNGTQTYPNGALGAYAQAATSHQQFTFAGGLQSAPMSPATRYRRGFRAGKYDYFLAGE